MATIYSEKLSAAPHLLFVQSQMTGHLIISDVNKKNVMFMQCK